MFYLLYLMLIAFVGIEYTHKDLKDNYVSTWDVLAIILSRKMYNVQNLGVLFCYDYH